MKTEGKAWWEIKVGGSPVTLKRTWETSLHFGGIWPTIL